MNSIDLQLQSGPLLHWHQAQGARLHGQLVESYIAGDDHGQCGLTDLTGLPRLGFKGADTIAWLAAQGAAIPQLANQALCERGVSTIRLSANEVFLAAYEAGDQVDAQFATLRSAQSHDLEPRNYLLERAHSHACFALSGRDCSTMLAKLCGVDLGADHFPPLAVAQTSLARINAIIVRLDDRAHPSFLVFVDMSSAEYLWQALLDAMHEFGGGALAYPDYRKRSKR